MGHSVLEASTINDNATASPTVLGICNGTRAGGIIQLAKCKSYLGAGKLTAAAATPPRLAGVHCLILRGPRQTIVRRWSSAARHNGQPFHDAVLNVGDRLQLGSIELEVLPGADEAQVTAWRLRLDQPRALATAEHETERDQERKLRETDLARRAAGIERTELELQQRLETSSRHTAELDQRHTLIDRLAVEICVREHEVDRRAAANDQLRIELDVQAEGLAERQSLLLADQAAAADLQRQLAEREMQHANTAEEIAARLTGIVEAEARLAERAHRLAVDEEQVSAQSQDRLAEDQLFAEQQAQLDRLRQELETARGQIEADQSQQQQTADALATREARLEQAEQECHRQREAIAARQAQLDGDQRQWDRQREELLANQQVAADTSASEVDATDLLRQEAAAALTRRETELISQQQQLATDRQQFEATLAHFSAERAELTARLADLDDAANANRSLQTELDNARQELVTRQQDFDRLCAARQAEWEAAQAQFEIDQARRTATEEDHEQLRRELASQQLVLEQRLADLETQTVLLEEQRYNLREREAAIEASPVEDDAPNDLPAENSGAPQSTEEAFRRLEALGLFQRQEDDESPAYETAQLIKAAEDIQPLSQVSNTRTDPEREFDGEADEELAIERYMSQLLDRMRESTGPASATWQPAERSPQPARSAATSPAAPVAAKRSADTSSPRREPAKRNLPNTDMSAMRELANQSARVAIHTHSRKLLQDQLSAQSLICLTLLVVGIALFNWTLWLGSLAFYAGFVFWAAAGVWFVKAAWLLRDLSRTPPSETPADDVADESRPTSAKRPATAVPEASSPAAECQAAALPAEPKPDLTTADETDLAPGECCSTSR